MTDTGTDTAETLLARTPTDLYIDGRWRASASGARFDVVNPADGEVIARVADAVPADGAAALDAAVAAAAGWAATAPRDRAEILRRAFELVREREEELALLMTLEMGKPLAEARGEVGY
ncbi:aldehyde dehydrogenase family protein, partial [Mycetocola reblochoni]